MMNVNKTGNKKTFSEFITNHSYGRCALIAELYLNNFFEVSTRWYAKTHE